MEKFNYKNAIKLLKFTKEHSDGYTSYNLGKLHIWCRAVDNTKKTDKQYMQFYLCACIVDDYVTFNLSIRTDGKGEIDILDENFCQPYQLTMKKDINKVKMILDDLISKKVINAEVRDNCIKELNGDRNEYIKQGYTPGNVNWGEVIEHRWDNCDDDDWDDDDYNDCDDDD